MTGETGSSDRAAAAGPPERDGDESLEQHPGFASKLVAHARRRLRSFADLRPNLSVRLLGSVLLFSACVTLILTVIQLYLEYRRDVATLESRVEQTSASYLDSVAESLWLLDEKQLRRQLAGILRIPGITAVEVRESDAANHPLVIALGEKSLSSAITREYPLHYNVQGKNLLIGTLWVQGSFAYVYGKVLDTALVILVSQAATIFLVSLFILYIFHQLVTRHLFAIASHVDSYRINDPPLPLVLRRPPGRHKDELQRVVTAFNALADDLQIAYRSLHYANDQLARDVVARREAETVLREREARIRRLIDANIIGIFIWEFEDRILEANDAFLRIVAYDREDLVAGNLHWTRLTPPEWRERTVRALAEMKMTGTIQPYEKEYFRKDGSRVPILLGSASFDESANQGVCFVLDLTERKQAEAEIRESERRYREAHMQLAHANRLATMGHLAASIAHEIAQPVAAAVTNADAALRWLDRRPPDLAEVRQSLSRIRENGVRAVDVIEGIRSLLKKAPPRMDRLEINEVILEVVALAHSELVKLAVSVRTQLAPGLPPVRGDRVQLQQVLLNLVMNAAEAMGETSDQSRDLLISTQIEPDGVLVAVRDSGPGLASSSLERLFEPFYTTKPGGLGMGLSICHSIVAAHGGRLWASANVPSGATFQFTVPAHPDAES